MTSTHIYTLSLHDALPIFLEILHRRTHLRPVGSGHREDIGIELTIRGIGSPEAWGQSRDFVLHMPWRQGDRKSTRLNSSHPSITYAVFCLKKRKLIQ